METRIASGLPAIAVWKFEVACSTDPSFWVRISWQFAYTLPQASSKPFFTACQNVFDKDEWLMNAIFS